MLSSKWRFERPAYVKNVWIETMYTGCLFKKGQWSPGPSCFCGLHRQSVAKFRAFCIFGKRVLFGGFSSNFLAVFPWKGSGPAWRAQRLTFPMAPPFPSFPSRPTPPSLPNHLSLPPCPSPPRPPASIKESTVKVSSVALTAPVAKHEVLRKFSFAWPWIRKQTVA